MEERKKKSGNNQPQQNHNYQRNQGQNTYVQRNQGSNNTNNNAVQDENPYPINSQRGNTQNNDNINPSFNQQNRSNNNMNNNQQNQTNYNNNNLHQQQNNNNNNNQQNRNNNNQNQNRSNNNQHQNRNNNQYQNSNNNSQQQNVNNNYQQPANNNQVPNINNIFQMSNNNQNGQNTNQQNRNQHQTNKHSPQDSETKRGKYIVDEFGDEFIQEEVDGELVKERIFIEKDKQNRAIHGSNVEFSFIIKNNYKNQNNNKNQNQRHKAQILSVKYPENLDSIIGYFGPKNKNSKKPEVDFDIKNRNISYENKNEFYFYPLQINYPKMILKLENAEEKYPKGELFKKYFKVRFISWPEELQHEGPLCEILDSQGYLYDEVSDCEALLNVLNINTHISPKEKECINKVIKSYNNLTKKNNYINYESLKVFTVDQQNTMAFDDAFSIEQISEQVLEQQKLLAKAGEINKKTNEEKKKEDKKVEEKIDKKGKKGSKKGEKDKQTDIKQTQNKKNQQKVQYLAKKDVEEQKNIKIEEKESTHNDEEEKNNDNEDTSKNDENNQSHNGEEQETCLENIKIITEEDQLAEIFEKKLNIDENSKQEQQQGGRKLYRLGIHISDLSRCIEEGSALYSGLEKKGQSIYLKLGKNKSFVKHMLDHVLVQQFSLKKGETRLAKSLFICIELDQDDKFIFHWDTFRIVDTKIKSQENYYYNEFDGFYKNINEIKGLYQSDNNSNDNNYDDSSESEEDDNQNDQIKNQKKLIIGQNEVQILFKLGGYLYQQRELKGQKAFQEEDIGKEKERSYSSLMVEEFMILYNQLVSRKLVVQKHLCQGNKEIDKTMEEQEKKADINIKQIKKNLKLIDQNIKNAEKQQKKEQLKLNKFVKEMKTLDNQIKGNDKVLLNYKKLIDKENQAILRFQDQLQKLQNTEQPIEDYTTDCTQQSTETESIKNNDMDIENPLSDEQNDNNSETSQQNDLQDQLDQQEQDPEHSEQSHAEETKKINPFTLRKNFEMQKLKQCQDRIQKLEQESKEVFNNKILDENKRKKTGFLRQVQYFEGQCKEVGFNGLKYEKLEQFQNSMRELKFDKKIEPIKRSYLLFKKRSILKDLDNYFAVCEKEKKQIQEHANSIKQKQQQIQKVNEEIKQINTKISELTKQENDFNIQQELQKKKQEEEIVIETQIEEDEIIVPVEEIEVKQDESKKLTPIEQKMNFLEKSIARSQTSIIRTELLITQNGPKLLKTQAELENKKIQKEKQEELLALCKKNIQSLIDQEDELLNQIDKIYDDLDQEEKDLLNNLKKQVNELHDYFEIIPESEKYVTLTSPIRKFNDIMVQQFLNLLSTHPNKFEKEYDDLIKHKQKNTKSRNEVRKFEEKAEKLKACRKILLKSYREKKLANHREDVLLIKSITFSQKNRMEFFLGKEMQLTRFFSQIQQAQFNSMSVWIGHVSAKTCLPYDFDLLQIQNNDGSVIQKIFQ